MKQLTREQMKKISGGDESLGGGGKGCTMDCTAPDHTYGTYLGTPCSSDSDCSSSSSCDSGYSKSFHCS
jgi:hypothetical protein